MTSWANPDASASPSHNSEASESEEWNVFGDPLEKRKRELNYRGSTCPIIDDLDDIEMELIDFVTTSLEQLGTLHFSVPENAVDCFKLTTSLLRLDSAVETTIKQLAEPGAQLLESQRRRLNNLRASLIEILYSRGNPYVEEPQKFTLAFVDRSMCMDTKIFRGALQCCVCLAAEPRTTARFAVLTPEHEAFSELRRHGIISSRIFERRLMDLNVQELMHAVSALESSWLYIPPLERLSTYLDLIMIRLGQLVLSPQPLAMFGTVTNYRHQINATEYEATQALLEDFTWALAPMYLKLAIYKTVTAREGSRRPAITKDEIRHIERFVTQNCLEMKNTGLTQEYIKAYMNFGLRPSESRRCRRDYPQQSITGAAVIEKTRGSEEKNKIMGILTKAPWIVVRDNLLERSELDVLILMMLNAYVCNAVGDGFQWLDVFVHFNRELLDKPDVADFLTRPYPVIVQSFNAFCVYDHGTHYSHERAAGAYAHWLSIMFSPEFGGKYEKYSLMSLHTLLPASVRSNSRR